MSRDDLPRLRRRALLGAGLAAALPLAARAATDWPSQTIRIIAPFPAGAVSDAITRAIAQSLQQTLGVSVVVENRPGVGGGIGTQQVIAARPDGHALLIANNATLSMVPRVSQLRFDPRRDLAGVAFLGDAYNLLAIDRTLPVTTLADFAALARQRPGELVYASPGVGSYGHIAGALLQRRLGIELLHAPFAGIVPAINAVLGGQAHAVMGPNALSFVQSGQMRGLVAVSETRWPALPDLPTLAESGVTDWPLSFWYGFLAPAGTPAPVRARLHAAIGEAAAQPAVATLIDRLGLRPRPLAPAALDALVARDWQAVGDTLEATQILG
ncbi:Bug family tripartite tricarboxylate transporter substrate binding protein [Falsiroseomonas sp.]|uniref:Bug family tripartite tricarboxylate transporter substrate binding protein n=1 Tax=Falsiroseomonas sp. TaxID=2870721 RepID=UPI003F6F7EBC